MSDAQLHAAVSGMHTLPTLLFSLEGNKGLSSLAGPQQCRQLSEQLDSPICNITGGLWSCYCFLCCADAVRAAPRWRRRCTTSSGPPPRPTAGSSAWASTTPSPGGTSSSSWQVRSSFSPWQRLVPLFPNEVDVQPIPSCRQLHLMQKEGEWWPAAADAGASTPRLFHWVLQQPHAAHM